MCSAERLHGKGLLATWLEAKTVHCEARLPQQEHCSGLFRFAHDAACKGTGVSVECCLSTTSVAPMVGGRASPKPRTTKANKSHACHCPCIAASLQIIVLNSDNEVFATLPANVGDRIIVKVQNRLNEPLSVHWHGMLQVSCHNSVRHTYACWVDSSLAAVWTCSQAAASRVTPVECWQHCGRLACTLGGRLQTLGETSVKLRMMQL